MTRARTFSSYDPRRRRDEDADRRRSSVTELATSLTATGTKLIFRAPSVAKITQVTLMVTSEVAAYNESYWSFQVSNVSRGNLSLIATAVTTQNSKQGKMGAGTAFKLNPDTNLYLQADDVLILTYTKTGSAPTLTNLTCSVEYEVEEGALGSTTTSSSTTTTTTTTTSTSSTVTTTSSTVTTTSSSTTTTTSTSSSTTISTTSTSSSTTTTTTTTITTTSTSSTVTVTTTSSTVTTTSSTVTTTSSSTTTTYTVSTSSTVTTTSSSTSTTTSTTVTTTSSSTTISTSTTVT